MYYTQRSILQCEMLCICVKKPSVVGCARLINLVCPICVGSIDIQKTLRKDAVMDSRTIQRPIQNRRINQQS